MLLTCCWGVLHCSCIVESYCYIKCTVLDLQIQIIKFNLIVTFGMQMFQLGHSASNLLENMCSGTNALTATTIRVGCHEKRAV